MTSSATEIANIIWQEQDELRLGLVSVTEVETSPDLRHARVYISTLGGEKEREAAVAMLRRRAGWLRHSSRRASPSVACRNSISARMLAATGAAVLRALNEAERMRLQNPPNLDEDQPPEPAPPNGRIPAPGNEGRGLRTEMGEGAGD